MGRMGRMAALCAWGPWGGWPLGVPGDPGEDGRLVYRWPRIFGGYNPKIPQNIIENITEGGDETQEHPGWPSSPGSPGSPPGWRGTKFLSVVPGEGYETPGKPPVA
eukprot:1015547-Prorocentrum_minimum.AAC.1